MALTLSKGPEKKTFSVAVNANGGGKISASASSVTEGDSVTITITPDSGYEVASASGLDDVPKSGGTFTISNVKANVNVNVTFQAVTPSPRRIPSQPTTPTRTRNLRDASSGASLFYASCKASCKLGASRTINATISNAPP